jgi:cytochrome b subunit of formate dehydrogenase
LHAHGPNAGIAVTRFSLGERIEHFLSMTSFTLLVLTGLPQLWPGSAFADVVVGLFGGIASTRAIHQVTGVLFIVLLAVHVVRALVRAVRERRLPIMFARRKDFADTVQTVRYFLDLAPAPRVGKFDFRAKFEYWGLFLGGTLMSVTGIMLLFPEVVSWVIPGSVIAAGRVLHGLEGTFAVLVVILWHTWSVILRPEIFPLDKSIFTGKIGLDRLHEEHPLEYERIFGTGSPDTGAGDTPGTTDATGSGGSDG